MAVVVHWRPGGLLEEKRIVVRVEPVGSGRSLIRVARGLLGRSVMDLRQDVEQGSLEGSVVRDTRWARVMTLGPLHNTAFTNKELATMKKQTVLSTLVAVGALSILLSLPVRQASAQT